MLLLIIFSVIVAVFGASLSSLMDATSNFKVHVVYMVFIHPQSHHWRSVLAGQLNAYVNSGLSSHVVETRVELGMKVDDTTRGRLDESANIIRSILPTASINLFFENKFEYPGINTAWEVGRNVSQAAEDSTLVLYFHSKCMVYAGVRDNDGRCQGDRLMFKYVIIPWRNVTRLFRDHPRLNKAGIGLAPDGCIWGNFWWARASHLKRLPRPEVTDDRYYYERWVGGGGPRDGLTLCPPGLPIGESYPNGLASNGSVVIPCWDYDPFPDFNPYLLRGDWRQQKWAWRTSRR